MACRGCAAKLPAQPLAASLQRVGLGDNPKTPHLYLAIKSCCKAWMAFQLWSVTPGSTDA